MMLAEVGQSCSLAKATTDTSMVPGLLLVEIEATAVVLA